MAQEINFIRPQEVYDRNTGESKVRYRSYDGDNRFIPVLEGENGVPRTMIKVTHAELKAMRDGGKLTAGALYRITDYNCTTTQENTQSAGHQFDIVLLALSKNKLAEEGWAMEHPTDVYDVTFSDGVTKKCYLYGPYDIDGSPNYNLVDISTLLGYSELTTDNFSIEGNTITIEGGAANSTDLTEENLTYNYFQNSNLSAWKVWYCLDNDKSRFAWADDSVDEDSPASIEDSILDYERYIEGDKGGKYAWHNSKGDPSVIYTDSEEPIRGDYTYIWFNIGQDFSRRVDGDVTSFTPAHEGTGLPNGRGVIYRLIDEFNNDIKYDFKNIQFVRKLTDGQYDADNGTETWCYTLNVWNNDTCQDASIVGNTMPNDEGYVTGVYDNIFGYATAYNLSIEGVNTFAFALGDNIVLSFDDGDGYYGIHSNTIGNYFLHNTIGNSFNSNIIGNYFHRNTIGDDFSKNSIGDSFNKNSIGNYFYWNIIGNNFNSKTISDGTHSKNYGNDGVELATKS